VHDLTNAHHADEAQCNVEVLIKNERDAAVTGNVAASVSSSAISVGDGARTTPSLMVTSLSASPAPGQVMRWLPQSSPSFPGQSENCTDRYMCPLP